MRKKISEFLIVHHSVNDYFVNLTLSIAQFDSFRFVYKHCCSTISDMYSYAA